MIPPALAIKRDVFLTIAALLLWCNIALYNIYIAGHLLSLKLRQQGKA